MRLPWKEKKRLYGPVAILATALIAIATITPAYAYFTDQSYATGGLVIQGPTTDIKERYGEKVKHVVITNNEDSVPVFVRVQVFANEEYLDVVKGDGWGSLESDGWYYFQSPVDPGKETTELLVTISFPVEKTIIGPDGEPITEEYDRTGENFNVVVVYEAVPVQYDNGGNLLKPEAADWSLKGGE